MINPHTATEVSLAHDVARLRGMLDDRLNKQMLAALKGLCNDIEATYTTLSRGGKPVITIGQFGRLHTAQAMVERLSMGGI